MNQQSDFQLKYPLSPRKFWKKILDRNLLSFVFIIPFIVVSSTFFTSSPVLMVVSGVIFLLFLLWNIAYAIYVKIYIKRYYYDCGENFVTIKKGVFAPTEIHVQYQKIQDVYVDQDILDRILGIYDVHIASATATSGIEAHIDGVSFEVAEHLKNTILAKINGVSNIPHTPLAKDVSSITMQLNQKISSDTYPISDKWLQSALLEGVKQSVFFTVFIGLMSSQILEETGVSFSNITLWAFILFAIVFLYKIIWISIWKSNYYFEFTPEFIVLKTGVIGRQENHLPYKSIQNVINKQSIIDRILGLSTVVIENAAVQTAPTLRGRSATEGSNISLVWQTPAKAQELNEIVNNIVSKLNPQNSNSMGL